MNNLKFNNSIIYSIFFHLFKHLYCIIFCAVILGVMLLSSIRVYAMKPSCYSYDTLYKALPSNYQKQEYIYKADGVAKLAFGSYKSSGIDYRTSMKHSGDTLYYCVNYNNHFTDNKTYIVNNTMYSDELRARIGLAMHLGTTTWNVKANKGYTTGHFITDYFMTQMVIHGLIYKYGGKYSDQGVDFDSLTFKSGTGNLSKKTTSLYKACCNAKFTSKKGNFQNAEFSFDKPSEKYLFYDESQSAYMSNSIKCNIDEDNGAVSQFSRESSVIDSSGNIVTRNVNINNDQTYNSSFVINIPIDKLHDLKPGLFTVEVNQSNTFHRQIANMWKCSDTNYTNNQEVMGLSYADTKNSDKISMKFFVGEVYIRKTDSVSGDNITDAEFELYQYDNTSKDYKFYRNFIYDEENKKYCCDDIFINKNNPERKFKVIESKAGKNYYNDWPGEEIIFSDNNPVVEINAENKPILGGLHIRKTGEDFTFNKDEADSNGFLISEKKLNLSKIKFELFAAEDIYNKSTLIYKADQSITEFVTDENGNADINDLLPGKYYFKEKETDNKYILNKDKINFEITYNDHQYSSFSYTMDNYLKNCSLVIFKYTSDLYNNINDDNNSENSSAEENTNSKIPISGCKFALYNKNDIYNASGKLILKKDTLISEATTDSDGIIKFNNLIYDDYYIKELSVPNGIVIKEEIINVDKNMFEVNAEISDKSYFASLHIFNNKQEYLINLYKYGQQFIRSQTEEDNNGSFSKYVLEYAPLQNVTYSLYDSNNKLVDTKTTDDNGFIRFNSLQYGDYSCVEVSAPSIYDVKSEPIVISCKQLKSDNNVNENGAIEISKEFNNNLCDFSLDLRKMGESVVIKDEQIQYNFVSLEGVVFGLYQNFDYQFPSGETLPINTCLGYIVTNKDGYGSYNGVLPEGQYYLKELKTLKGYDIDKNIHSFEIKSNNNNSIHIDLSNEPFKNYLSKSAVKIIKTDANTGKCLKGVEFTLYNTDNKIIGVYKTNRKGEILVDNLPYGNYYFIESKSINGYYSSNNKYSFTLDSGDTRILQITNTPILKLGFEENYKQYLIILLFITVSLFIFIFFNISHRGKKDE